MGQRLVAAPVLAALGISDLRFQISVPTFEICDLRCRNAALLLQACHSISTQPTSTAESGFIARSVRKEWLDGRARRYRIDIPMQIPVPSHRERKPQSVAGVPP
jgi:hypothetical protein